MALTIARIDDEEIASAFAPESQVDPELKALIEGMSLGQGFLVTPDEGESERKIKRRTNATARAAGFELDWRPYNGKLLARLSATIAPEGREAPKAGRPRRGA